MPQVKLSAIILLTVIVLQGCKGKPDTSSQQALMEASKMELATAVNERDRLISLIGEITSGMDQIKHLENILTVTASQPEQASQRQQILADISSIPSMHKPWICFANNSQNWRQNSKSPHCTMTSYSTQLMPCEPRLKIKPKRSTT